MGTVNQQIKSFINVTYEYHLRKTEKNLIQLQRQLQILSVVSDLSIFEPISMETLEFFVCLEKLLIESDQKSPLSWKVINLLLHISHSPKVRKAMRDEMQLLPVISQYLTNSKLSKDKSHKTLLLLQDLSYGIKIQRREAWLINIMPYLISMILDSENLNNEIEPALIILSNICRGNPPAISLLRESSERKMLLRSLTNLRSPTHRVQLVVSEIMIYINVDYTKLGTDQIIHTLDLLFMVAADGITNENENMLQLARDVFEEFANQSDICVAFKKYSKFESIIENIMNCINEKSSPQCVGIACELLALVILLEYEYSPRVLESLLTEMLSWLPNKESGIGVHKLFQALISISSDSLITSNLEKMLEYLKECLTLNESECTVKVADWVSSVMNIIEALCFKDATIHFNLAKSFSPAILSSLINQLLKEPDNEIYKCDSQSSISSVSDCQEMSQLSKRKATLFSQSTQRTLMDSISEAVVQILSVIKHLCSQNPEFKIEYRQILGNPRVMKYIVFCQRSSKMNLVKRASSVLSEESIPGENLGALIKAHAEANIPCQSFNDVREYDYPESSYQASSSSPLSVPPLSEEAIDKLLSKLNGTVEKAELKDIPLTEVMGLYEFKLVALIHNERNLQNALAAADSQVRETRLELLQAKAESSKLRSMLMTWEERLQKSKEENIGMHSRINEIQQSARKLRNELVKESTRLERENASLKGELLNSRQEIEKKVEENNHLQRQIEVAASEQKSSQKFIKQLQDDIQKLNDSLLKSEEEKKKIKREVEDLEKEGEKQEKKYSLLKKENNELEMLIRSHEESLAEKENQIDQMHKENATLKKIQDMIHNISSGKTGKI
ncbi:Protein CIP2A [Armadillidium nasatum]|uniref:Protein CIP2A n=1 Tax=Armadillidium nasatum TaxID=96803 RepID=A0A5N5TGH2_9CRUS|nr:Protein CIP2A [Armadillidium nasatum]